MKIKRFYIATLLVAGVMCSCDDVWEPAIENNQDLSLIYTDPQTAENLIGNAYIKLWGAYPNTNDVLSDVATDDAVCNDVNNAYLKIALGAWSRDNNPLSLWDDNYHILQYINLMLENCDDVNWSSPEVMKVMYADHFKGEAYAFRGIYHYSLLQRHAGIVDGQMLGVPLHLASEEASSDFNLPRNTFKECVDQILSDFDQALSLLPSEFGTIAKDAVPAKYVALAQSEKEKENLQAYYDRAFGKSQIGRIDAKIIKAIRAQVLFLAASPAYSEYSGVTYKQAADAFAEVLKGIGGLSGLDPNGHKWSTDPNMIEPLASDENPAEVIWRAGMESKSNTNEQNFFPPSIGGKGRVNPTQNLVDAFPMANGIPITDNSSGYNSNDPYANRDPRLYEYIVYNGSQPSLTSPAIDVTVESSTDDGINKQSGSSTRTGYYMRKFTRNDVNYDAEGKSLSSNKHYTTRIRYTEMFLNYAEAANEAYGPTDANTAGYSAYDVIKAIRKRAGIAEGSTDNYLEALKGDKDQMRELIRNERRLELCFEGKRFWDLRRWKVSLDKLNETAKGMRITGTSGNYKYEVIDVETRNYKDYMYYGPIPYTETVKYDNLKQNEGW